jgi:uncharacterized membrane protein YciS (DUF1049 family)
MIRISFIFFCLGFICGIVICDYVRRFLLRQKIRKLRHVNKANFEHMDREVRDVFS